MVGRHAGLGVNCLFSVRRLSVTPLYSKRACTFPHIFSLPAKFLPLLDTGLVTTDKETVIVIQVFDTYYCSSLFVSGVYEPCCHCWPPTTTTYQYYHPTNYNFFASLSLSLSIYLCHALSELRVEEKSIDSSSESVCFR